jgi:O-acetyl-ADP-ribose deacetylase (regulator of RNase III)
MIEFAKGNLLEAPVEALVNTVNTVGVMGKGIALQFRQAFPAMFRDYEKACKNGEVQLGRVYLFDLGGLPDRPQWIINFPTKEHWRASSRIADIEAGLTDLVDQIRKLGIQSIALPPLGCGNGGLDWNDVRPKIEAAFAKLPSIRVLLYAPTGAPTAAAMPNRTAPPKMTAGRAALVALMDRYLKGLLDPFVSLLEIHKLVYFLQAAGEPLKLEFVQAPYGPYSPNLRHVLTRLESHLTTGYAGEDSPETPIELMPGAVEAAEAFLAFRPETRARMDRVSALIEGFEDSYGMELLSSVHWVMQRDPATRDDSARAVAAVHAWSDRKRRLLKSEHILKAWQRLKDRDVLS